MPWPLTRCKPSTGLGGSAGAAALGDELGWGRYQPWDWAGGTVDVGVVRCEPGWTRVGLVSRTGP